MQVIEARFSWEVDQQTGSQTILFPTYGQARNRALELIKDHIDDHIANAERYGNEPEDLELTVEFERVSVVGINRETFCNIINSSGGSYSVKQIPLGKITKKWSAK